MLKYSAIILLVALTAHASAFALPGQSMPVLRQFVDTIRSVRAKRSAEETVIVSKPTHHEWHEDRGFPEFDGNPVKTILVAGQAFLSELLADEMKGAPDADVPALLKEALEAGKKTNWKSFDEYMDFWGNFVINAAEQLEKESEEKEKPIISEDSSEEKEKPIIREDSSENEIQTEDDDDSEE